MAYQLLISTLSIIAAACVHMTMACMKPTLQRHYAW